MEKIKKDIKPSIIAVAVALFSVPAFASLEIVTDSDRDCGGQTELGKSDATSVSVSGIKAEDLISASFTEMPLILVLSHIVPKRYELKINENAEDLLISWSGSKSWESILKDFEKNYGISIGISDTTVSVKAIALKGPSETAGEVEKTDPVTPVVSRSVELIDCPAGDCDEGLVDIEKLVLDTSWAALDTTITSNELVFDGGNDSHDEAELTQDMVASEEGKVEAEALEKEAKRVSALTRDYNASYILHGDGSFAEFANGGGTPQVESIKPDDAFTYVYRSGTLFESINKWAEANGYTVRNDVLNHYKKDYPNYTNVRIKGSFFNATTALLNKYEKAEVPINHRFYTKGKVLHIFVGKYN